MCFYITKKEQNVLEIELLKNIRKQLILSKRTQYLGEIYTSENFEENSETLENAFLYHK